MTSTTEPRYRAIRATYDDSVGGQSTVWGVLDTQETRFAPFGGTRELAEFAAERIAEMPDLPWEFLAEFTEAPRYAWIKAAYPDPGYGQDTAWGAVDNELDAFYPFSNNEHDPDAQGFVESVASHAPGFYSSPATFTRL